MVLGLVAACGSSEEGLFGKSSSGQGGAGGAAGGGGAGAEAGSGGTGGTSSGTAGTAGAGGSGCETDCSEIQTPECMVAVCNEQLGQCEIVPAVDVLIASRPRKRLHRPPRAGAGGTTSFLRLASLPLFLPTS